MKANTKPSTTPGEKAAPPLRSTTVVRSPATNRASTGASSGAGGVDSIRLNTYHDSSDLKAALRELEAAFAVQEGAADASGTDSFFSPARPTRSDTNRTDKDTRASQPGGKFGGAASASSAKSKPVTVVVQTKRAAAASSSSPSASPPPPLPSRRRAAGPSRLLQLPPQLLLRCFAFCDLKSLGVLCCVSVRLNVMVEQQGTALWAAAALRRRVPIANAAASRAELRRALTQQAEARHAEEAFYEDEIARMEERLRVRAENVYAQNVDVNRTIATGGGGTGISLSVPDTAGAAPPYWLRHQQATSHAVDGGTNGAAGASMDTTSAQLCAKLLAEIEALEETKRLCECKVSLQEASLREQEVQLQQWQALLTPGATPASASAPIKQPQQAGAAASPLVTAAQLDQFERRIARLVLNGGTTTTTATPTTGVGGDATPGDIPFVLRHGVADFARLELVLRALGAHTHAENAVAAEGRARGAETMPRTHAAEKESGAAGASQTNGASSLSAAVRDAGKRWRAFQQVCPVNEEYGNVRTYVKAQELRTAASGVATAQLPGADSAGGARPSTKQTPALLRVSGFVRRVEAMTDSQVVQAWM